jgi:segregation and condensation protein B
MPESVMPEPFSQRAEELAASYGEQVQQSTWDIDVTGNGGDKVSERLSEKGSDPLPGGLTPFQTASGSEVVSAGAPPSELRILEAMLFVGGTPLTAEKALKVVRGLAADEFVQAINALNRDYRLQGRPYTIQSLEGGYSLALRPRFKPIAERLYGQAREARLSPAAIDVLSLVAYRQPVTKREIDSIRGAESGGLLRQLVRRRLITIVRRGESTSREVSYGTTARFLELFNVRSLDDLPQTGDLQKL